MFDFICDKDVYETLAFTLSSSNTNTGIQTVMNSLYKGWTSEIHRSTFVHQVRTCNIIDFKASVEFQHVQ